MFRCRCCGARFEEPAMIPMRNPFRLLAVTLKAQWDPKTTARDACDRVCPRCLSGKIEEEGEPGDE